MRLRTFAVFGFAALLSGMTGCAATRHTSQNELSWQQQSPTTAWQTPYLEHDYSVGSQAPAHPTAPCAPDEFAFSHPRVESAVTRFQTSLRGFFSEALSRSGRYVPRMSSILQRQGLPQQLAYLPLIESGYRTQAVSPAGAVGPWQFIPDTGRRYGLRIDEYVDERRDPVKSTEAAARYLRDLHSMFGDWHLSLAAYNTGEQNISRILDRSNAADYWEISERGYLCRETANYVPRFLAALQIANAPEEYGFDRPYEEPVRYDLVHVGKPLPLSTVAQLCGSSTDTIRELNPALHRGVVPPQGYSVRLPKGSKEIFQVAYANYTPPRVVRSSHRKARGHRVIRKQRTRRFRGPAVAQREEAPVLAQRKAHHRIWD